MESDELLVDENQSQRREAPCHCEEELPPGSFSVSQPLPKLQCCYTKILAERRETLTDETVEGDVRFPTDETGRSLLAPKISAEDDVDDGENFNPLPMLLLPAYNGANDSLTALFTWIRPGKSHLQFTRSC